MMNPTILAYNVIFHVKTALVHHQASVLNVLEQILPPFKGLAVHQEYVTTLAKIVLITISSQNIVSVVKEIGLFKLLMKLMVMDIANALINILM